VSVVGVVVPNNVVVSQFDGWPAVYDTLRVSPLTVPPPELATDTVNGAGFDEPVVVVKATVVGERLIASAA